MIINLPYTSLKTFEAVVRLRGFGRAAVELGVSQSAVSQHVKALEEWTNQTLIVRGHRESRATRDGKLLADAVADGLGQICEVCVELRSKRRADMEITVSCPPGFGVNWLFPRLIDFDQTYPGTRISISTTADPGGILTRQEDVAIRYGPGTFTGLHVERLIGERIFPVCSPRLAEQDPGIHCTEDVFKHTLLVDELADIGGNPPTWYYWAEKVGTHIPHNTRTRQFSQSNMVVQAAVQGFGVALGREPLVVDALRLGQLIRPLPGFVTSEFSYWFVCTKANIRSKRIGDFRDWLMQQADAQPTLDRSGADPAAD